MSYRIVIPARYGSRRLPGKPLADIQGRPMVVWVADAAARSGAAEVVVATDNEPVARAVTDAGHAVVLTRPDHPSGTDRVMEVAARRGWEDHEVVLNLQGDEPLMPPAVLDQLAAALQRQDDLACATLCEPITRPEDLNNPNIVKVVRTGKGRALYFSRAAIPFHRDADDRSGTRPAPAGWRHIGLYAYRVWALKRFVSLPDSTLEKT